jgi:DNA polymerase-3 subunit epsilon
MSQTPETPPQRHTVVVDVETNGLDSDLHHAVEVAWWNIDTGDAGCFVPPHDVHKTLAHGQIKALQVNRYLDRLAEAEQDHRHRGALELASHLSGAALAGSNPAFDAGFLRGLFARAAMALGKPHMETEPWHHRKPDLASYAAGVLCLPTGSLPGLAAVCDALGLSNQAPHTAWGDVCATVRCFERLYQRASALHGAQDVLAELLTLHDTGPAEGARVGDAWARAWGRARTVLDLQAASWEAPA